MDVIADDAENGAANEAARDASAPALSTGLTRDQAFALLERYNKDPFHIQHAETLEGLMRYYAEKYDPARITRYCIDVASAYHRFYNACRILDAEGAVQQGRIALCLAVRGVIHNILTMFKVNAPETM